MASRRKGRILAFQALYSWDVTPSALEELLSFSWLETEKRDALDGNTAEFSRLLIQGTIENIGAVDDIIRAHLKNWDFSRLNRVDLALLRMSAYTLIYQNDVSPSIVIDEAIGISREFGTDDSYRFINGVLDSIRRTLQGPQPLEGAPK
ncbi:transcription antitermination factor NusB [Treponema primitia]|uniref:transcription antitermination factor NusB n=1 Tax=Treponema primitia TaxID=88058 RepID=UPI0002554CE7|nr:transcription antitermination factor NusB [Treponema primitia]